jgi:hypothetical protein
MLSEVNRTVLGKDDRAVRKEIGSDRVKDGALLASRAERGRVGGGEGDLEDDVEEVE